MGAVRRIVEYAGLVAVGVVPPHREDTVPVGGGRVIGQSWHDRGRPARRNPNVGIVERPGERLRVPAVEGREEVPVGVQCGRAAHAKSI